MVPQYRLKSGLSNSSNLIEQMIFQDLMRWRPERRSLMEIGLDEVGDFIALGVHLVELEVDLIIIQLQSMYLCDAVTSSDEN